MIRQPAGPVRLPGIDDGPKGPPPLLGQHSHEILRVLGYYDDEISRLSGKNIVKLHQA